MNEEERDKRVLPEKELHCAKRGRKRRKQKKSSPRISAFSPSLQ